MLTSRTLFMAGWLSAAFGASAYADEHKPANCDRTAVTMAVACRHDTRDDFLTTRANCLNIADFDDRMACMQDSRDIRNEDNSECRDVREARQDACELLGENRYDPDPLLDPANVFIDPDDVPDIWPVNPYVSIAAGHTYVLRAGEEEEETVVVHVTEDSREVQGVLCRIVVDIVVETSVENGDVEYEAVEATDDLFAQDENGNIVYCGEVSRNFEDGVLRDLEGSFESGIEYAKAGFLIKAAPVVGEAHRQEYALGDAEDIVQYLDTATAPTAEEGGDNAAFPCAPNLCLKTLDLAPIDPESTEFKYYLPNTGFVLAVAMEDEEFTGEREELVCVGDSLDILSDPSCEIADPELLLEELCKLSPDAFCVE